LNCEVSVRRWTAGVGYSQAAVLRREVRVEGVSEPGGTLSGGGMAKLRLQFRL